MVFIMLTNCYACMHTFHLDDNNTQQDAEKGRAQSVAADGGEYTITNGTLIFLIFLVTSSENLSRRILYSSNSFSVTWNDFLCNLNDQCPEILLYPHICSIGVHDVS